MNNSIYKELLAHAIDTLENTMEYNSVDEIDCTELHFAAFNEDYYIIGYHNANEWLKEHDLSAFDAIAEVIEQHQAVFGEVNIKPEDINSEWVVNQLTYFYGDELLSNFDLDQSATDLLAELKAA